MGKKQAKIYGSETVHVAVRCRPFSQKELMNGHTKAVAVRPDTHDLTLLGKDATEPARQFTFDQTFDESAEQDDIYNKVARNIVDSVLEGYNGTVFAYGQTGSGARSRVFGALIVRYREDSYHGGDAGCAWDHSSHIPPHL